MIGTTLSHYRILEPLGAGGMGVVYRARDERLERDVAIKVLPAGALADEGTRKQFRKEALALSRLNHSHIATVHDFDSSEGVDFLVMELVAGRTVSEMVAGGPLTEAEVRRLGVQLAEGLAAAHRQGILHRDIKPGNLKLTPEGQLKILDFGLAKVVKGISGVSATETVSAQGAVAGTLPYMSPEQLTAGSLDARSDVYSAGAVLYEMACGRKAFPQDSPPGVVGAILGQPPTAPHEIVAGLSADLERIILRCLEKNPAHRYRSAEDLAEDLRQLDLPESQRRLGKVRVPRRSARAALFTTAGALATASLALALNLGGIRDQYWGSGATTIHSIAVLPLVNLSHDPEQEYFSDGMTDELITRLAQIGALRVISRSSAMQYKGTKKPLRAIARELHIGMVVEGSVMRSGNMVRITAQLVDVLKDRHLWAESYERSLTNVLALQSDIARAIVERVRVRVTPEERTRLARGRKVNPDALEAYLRGRWHLNQFSGEGFQNAIKQFTRSTEIDPGYAPAYVGLSDTYSWMSGTWLPMEDAMPRARAAAMRALELDPNLAAAHASLANVQMVQDWSWNAAEQSCRRAIELGPGEVTAHMNYGMLLTALGRFDEAEREIARARDVDPLSPLIASTTLFPLFEGRQYDRTIAAAQRLVSVAPTAASPRMILGQALLFQGEPTRAVEEIQKAIDLDSTLTAAVVWLGYAHAVSGQRAKALEILDRLRAMQKKGTYVQPYSFATLLVGLGEKEKAIDWLSKAADAHSDELFFLKVDPVMDPLRSEPRFQAIMARMGFPA